MVYILTTISPNTWWSRTKNHRGRVIWTTNPRVFCSDDSKAIPHLHGSHKITKIEFCKLKLDSWLTLPGFERQKLKNDECTRERASWCAPLEIDKKRAAGERVKKREPAPRRAARVNWIMAAACARASGRKSIAEQALLAWRRPEEKQARQKPGRHACSRG
jgi:hypothetical protein